MQQNNISDAQKRHGSNVAIHISAAGLAGKTAQLMPIAFLGRHLLECKMHAQNTARGQTNKNIDGFDLNGMEKCTCKVSSPKIEAAIPYNQNLFHFPSFPMCSTNVLRNSIVIGTKQVLICF